MPHIDIYELKNNIIKQVTFIGIYNPHVVHLEVQFRKLGMVNSGGELKELQE